jgi:hypothetical protein
VGLKQSKFFFQHIALQTAVETETAYECLLGSPEICLFVVLLRLTACTMKCGIHVESSFEFVVEAS